MSSQGSYEGVAFSGKDVDAPRELLFNLKHVHGLYTWWVTAKYSYNLSTWRFTPSPVCLTQWYVTLPSKCLHISLGVVFKVIACMLLTKCLFGVAGCDEPHCAHQWVFPYRRKGFCKSIAFFFLEKCFFARKSCFGRKDKPKKYKFWSILAEKDIP